MRLLLISQFYPPDVGGVEVHVRALAHGLAARGHDVAVATLSAPDLPAEEDEDGVFVHRLRATAQRLGALHATERRHAPPVPDPEAVLGLGRLVRDFEPDVVHAHNWLGRSFVPLKALSRARYVVTFHDCGRTCAQGRMMYRDAELCAGPARDRCRECAAHHYGALKGALTLHGNDLMRGPEERAVDLFLAVSTAVAEANRLGATGVPFEIVPNFSAEAPRDAPEDDPRLAALPDAPFVLQVGDVVADKGVGVLLDAYARLSSPPPLVLVGRAEGLSRDLPDGVTVTGRWPHELVAEAWRRSVFGTMPSLCLDASPTVTLEAMAAARPVVASARGGLTDQVADGVTGLLVPPGDADALAAAMQRLLADPGLRERMGAAARERYERRFSAEVVVGRIEQLYRSLLSDRTMSANTG